MAPSLYVKSYENIHHSHSFPFLSLLSLNLFAEEDPCLEIKFSVLDEELYSGLADIGDLNASSFLREEITIDFSFTDFLDTHNPNLTSFGVTSTDPVSNSTFRLISEQESDERTQDLSDSLTRVAIIIRSRDVLANDKFLHFAVGAGISEVTSRTVRGYLPPGREGDRMANLIAFGVTSAIGVAKEIRDRQGFGTPEVADAVWTSAGSGLSVMRLNYRF